VSARYSATRTALRTGGIMVLFTLVFTALMASTYVTRPAIEASAQEAQMRLIDEVLPPGSYDNDLLADVVRFGPRAAARHGRRRPGLARAQGRRAGRAGRRGRRHRRLRRPHRAGGRDRHQRQLSGVRVTHTRKPRAWATTSTPRRTAARTCPGSASSPVATWKDVNTAEWTVRKDGGSFGYRTGATISARAVVRAAGRSTAFVAERQDALFAAPAGGLLGE
jgi:electron transport complex protein RnfG